jgi:hypothetical protein
MLFERHKFNRFTNGRFPMSAWNNPMAGGYGEDSWNKLSHAACQDVDAAFSAAAGGGFRCLGNTGRGSATQPAGDGLFDGRLVRRRITRCWPATLSGSTSNPRWPCCRRC